MYIITLTYYPESADEVMKLLDGIPVPNTIDVNEINDPKIVERIRETGKP